MSQFGSQSGGNKLPGASGGTPTKAVITGHAEETSSIGLINDAEASTSEHKMRAIVGSGSVRKTAYKRTPVATGSGSCRVRSFHGRLSDQGLEYMDNQINEWIDNHPEVEVKFVTSSVGIFEGKMREPALIMNLWY